MNRSLSLQSVVSVLGSVLISTLVVAVATAAFA